MIRFRHSLADARPGEVLEVVHVLFGSLRRRYEESGIRVGARLRVLERSPEGVRLELEDGRTAEVVALHAPFVEVSPLAQEERPLPCPHVVPGPESALHAHANTV